MDALKETVVLLHCSGSSGSQWRSLAERLGAGYRVMAPDLIGYGANRKWVVEEGFTLAREAAPIIADIREPVHLVGHSYGGAVALHIARTRPQLVRSLTLIEPSAFHLLRDGDAIDAAALREITEVAFQARTSLASGDHLGGYGRFADYWNPGSWDAMPADKRASFAPQLGKVTRDFEAIFSERVGSKELRLAMPALLVQGGCTTLPARCVVDRLRKTLPAAAFRVVQGAGHMLPITHRDQVNALIALHVDSNANGALREAA
jgi:pimeloyl-ACP methyl ester carboxylesterase